MIRFVYEYLMVLFGYPKGKVTFRILREDGSSVLKSVHFRRELDIPAATYKLWLEESAPIKEITIAYLHGNEFIDA